MTNDERLHRNREYVKKCRAGRSIEQSKHNHLYYTRTWRSWITRHAWQAILEDKSKGRGCDLDLGFINKLYSTNEKCAISGLTLTHDFSLWSLSIDRIDNSIGHTKLNTQLVCRGINLAKNRHTNADVIYFVECIKDPSLFKPEKFSRDYISTCVRNAQAKFAENDINTDKVVELYRSQNGECALAGVKMACYAHPCLSLSIDRIDNKIGYLVTNIRLVLKAINRARSTFDDLSVIKWINDIKANHGQV